MSLAVPGWDTPDGSHPDPEGAAVPWEPATLYPIASNISISADIMEPTRKHSGVAAVSVTPSANTAALISAPQNYTITMSELKSLERGMEKAYERHAGDYLSTTDYGRYTVVGGTIVDVDRMADVGGLGGDRGNGRGVGGSGALQHRAASRRKCYAGGLGAAQGKKQGERERIGAPQPCHDKKQREIT